MEPFTYTDIFETKGMEYLIIIAFLVLLVPFWIYVNRDTPAVKGVRQALGTLAFDLLNVPQGLLFSRNHTWAYLQSAGTARVGLDDFLVKATGTITVNQLIQAGQPIRKGQLLATIGQDGKELRIYSPISGEVVEANAVLNGSSALIRTDPYGKGWICGILPEAWKEETGDCYIAGEATSWMRSELDRLRDFLAISIGRHAAEPGLVALQEGGELRSDPLAAMKREVWEDFQAEFLDTP